MLKSVECLEMRNCLNFHLCVNCSFNEWFLSPQTGRPKWGNLVTARRNHLWLVTRRLLDPAMPEENSKDAMRTPATSEKVNNNNERPTTPVTTVNIPLVNEVQLTAATGGAELSCYRCTIPFGVVVLIAGIVVTAVAYSFNSHGSTISYFGLVLLSAGLVLLASSAVCWKMRLERKKERRRESQTALVANQRSIFTWTSRTTHILVLWVGEPAVDRCFPAFAFGFPTCKSFRPQTQNWKLWRHCQGFICQTDAEHLASWERGQQECITIKMNYHCAKRCGGSLPLIRPLDVAALIVMGGIVVWKSAGKGEEKIQDNDSCLVYYVLTRTHVF